MKINRLNNFIHLTDLDLLHFEQLKTEVQAQYLKEHHPSFDDISKWKGIDIIYFQEDLRKRAKGNISEKTFYTYFKTLPVSKLPRIDMLNILSIYVGYTSWYDFKKNHLFENETLNDSEKETLLEPEVEQSFTIFHETPKNLPLPKEQENIILQKNTNDNQLFKEKSTVLEKTQQPSQNSLFSKIKKYVWLIISGILATIVAILGFGDHIWGRNYTYCFIDSDRNTKINNVLEIKVIKENESPILYRVKPGECFYYPSKDKTLKMEVSSPFYETALVFRNLENAPREETIELKPDDYAIMLHYFSTKEVSSSSLEQIKVKQQTLNNLISDRALIYQVFDNEFYGVETLTKQKYIGLVTTPTKSMKNLKVIETKREKGKIVLIKFKIESDEKK